ncbi:MAG: DNA adenine methylase [Chloroflexi bacterium]|nr:DNA adenine methylase [Chloroflexota bacterium]MDA1240200.1 DNA adenine methylase [Chloroflexota bacterium]
MPQRRPGSPEGGRAAKLRSPRPRTRPPHPERAAISPARRTAADRASATGEGVLARPFLKWAGGKGQILEPLVARAPRQIAGYHEPFIGGGAMFFGIVSDAALRPRHAVLNDLNGDLVTVYEVVRDEVERLIARLEVLAGPYLAADEDERARLYYVERAREPMDRVDLAARFIFLNKTCFNGLYRVNRRGEFNVPHGKYRQPRILDEPVLRSASTALRTATLRSADFEEAMAGAQAGDFVYLDPPFEPLSKTSSFTGYTRGSFDRNEQVRLKWAVDALTERGVHVMLSNSPQDFISGLYRADRGPLGGHRYRFETTPARRAINSRGDRRGAIDELIVMNYPAEVERRSLSSASPESEGRAEPRTK